MKLIPCLFVLMVPLAACQTGRSTPYAPVEDIRYNAIGQDPFWMVAIGDDRIVLTLAPGPGAQEGEMLRHDYPRTLPRTVDGIRTWTSGDGTAVISVEAMPGPCIGAAGAGYEHRVRVRLSGRELHGCGGRRLPRGNG